MRLRSGGKSSLGSVLIFALAIVICVSFTPKWVSDRPSLTCTPGMECKSGCGWPDRLLFVGYINIHQALLLQEQKKKEKDREMN